MSNGSHRFVVVLTSTRILNLKCGYGNGVDDAYGVDIAPAEQAYLEPEPESIGPTLIVRAKRGRPSKADIEARKTLSTTTTTTPNRAPKKSKILKNINN